MIFPHVLGSSQNSCEKSSWHLLAIYFWELSNVPVLVQNFGNKSKHVSFSFKNMRRIKMVTFWLKWVIRDEKKAKRLRDRMKKEREKFQHITNFREQSSGNKPPGTTSGTKFPGTKFPSQILRRTTKCSLSRSGVNG
jgi:hypothetical protein